MHSISGGHFFYNFNNNAADGEMQNQNPRCCNIAFGQERTNATYKHTYRHTVPVIKNTRPNENSCLGNDSDKYDLI